MTPTDYQQLIRKLQVVIDDTQQILECFETAGMDEQMPGDYDKLLRILGDAVKQQHQQTLLMLEHRDGNVARIELTPRWSETDPISLQYEFTRGDHDAS